MNNVYIKCYILIVYRIDVSSLKNVIHKKYSDRVLYIVTQGRFSNIYRTTLSYDGGGASSDELGGGIKMAI